MRLYPEVGELGHVKVPEWQAKYKYMEYQRSEASKNGSSGMSFKHLDSTLIVLGGCLRLLTDLAFRSSTMQI